MKPELKGARCRKHVPESTDAWRGMVRCSSCGMEGQYSNGNRRVGRPRRIIWFRRDFRRAAEVHAEIGEADA